MRPLELATDTAGKVPAIAHSVLETERRIGAQFDACLDLDSRDGLLAFKTLPTKDRRQIWSTNRLETLNKEIKGRTDFVGVFPNGAAPLRLAGTVFVEQHAEREAVDHRYRSESSLRELATTARDTAAP